jgi:hypothetical protein
VYSIRPMRAGVAGVRSGMQDLRGVRAAATSE